MRPTSARDHHANPRFAKGELVGCSSEGAGSGAAFVRGEDADAGHNDAAWLLDFYQTFADFGGRDVTDTALNSLANVKGQFGAALDTHRSA